MTIETIKQIEQVEEKGEAIMIEVIETIEEVEEVTIEMLDKDFPDPKLSKSQEIEIEKMVEKVKELRVEEALHENDARFFGICSTFEETMKRGYLAGLEFKLENATLVLLGNDENEAYYMEVSDLGKLSEDIKYFRDKVLEREVILPKFEKVELDFIIEKLDFRDLSYYDVYLIEITK